MDVLRCNALHVLPRTTLADFTPVLVLVAARLLVSCCQWMPSCCQLGDKVLDFLRRVRGIFWATIPSLEDASNAWFQFDPTLIETHLFFFLYTSALIT